MTDGHDRGEGARPLRPSGFFAYRVPALPMAALTAWAEGVEAPAAPPDDLASALEADRRRLRRRLAAIAARADVHAALSVASPDLRDALAERPGDPGVEAALVRYVTRMATRPTPFGLFVGCGVGSIAQRTSLALPAPATWRRHTQIDADHLDALAGIRLRVLRRRAPLRCNDSLHSMGGRWRYAESRLTGIERSHHLVEVADSRHLRRALEAARDGATPADVAAAVEAAGAAADVARRYVDQLVAAQVLVSELSVAITGAPPLTALIRDLEGLGDHGVAEALADVKRELAALDAADAAAAPQRQDRIRDELRRLGTPVDRARALRVDLIVPDGDATLASSTVADMVRGVELLRQVAAPFPESDLDVFRDAFRGRYEGREVPLLEALDEELGIGFGPVSERGDPAPLLKGLPLTRGREPAVPNGRRELQLLELLQRPLLEGALELSLTREDVEALRRDDVGQLPDAVAVIATLARTPEGPRIVLAGASGPSGAGLLARFCHSDRKLAEHVRAHLRAEEALDPDAAYAEIVHHPSGGLANVVVRPHLRDHEIEWLGRSGAAPERRIPAADLMLSLRDESFVLRSRSSGRRVIPRLTSAHNYNRRSPGVYRFLAALQKQNTAVAQWSWSPFEFAPFRPRLRYGRLVLARAGWRLTASELRTLDRREPAGRWRAVQELRERRRLPRWITVGYGESMLAVDLDNALSVEAFVRLVRRDPDVQLEELYPGPDGLVAESAVGRHVMEVVVPLVREAAVHGVDALPAGPPPAPVRRTFPPGSDWSYLKLYTGSATADRLLVEAVAPLARELTASGVLDRWFFLRYADPGRHLRVRFHGPSDAIRGPLEQLAARAIDAGLAHDALLGTYRREIERYGGPAGILVAERLFHADSIAVVELLGMFERGERGLDERWRIGLLGAEMLMSDLGLDVEARAAHCRGRRAAFERELRVDARVRKGVSSRLREEREPLCQLLDAGPHGDHPLAAGMRVLVERSERIAPLAAELAALRAAGRLTTPTAALATPYVHMWLNRLCRSDPRSHEYVTYALLTGLHALRSARTRSS